MEGWKVDSQFGVCRISKVPNILPCVFLLRLVHSCTTENVPTALTVLPCLYVMHGSKPFYAHRNVMMTIQVYMCLSRQLHVKSGRLRVCNQRCLLNDKALWWYFDVRYPPKIYIAPPKKVCQIFLLIVGARLVEVKGISNVQPNPHFLRIFSIFFLITWPSRWHMIDQVS